MEYHDELDEPFSSSRTDYILNLSKDTVTDLGWVNGYNLTDYLVDTLGNVYSKHDPTKKCTVGSYKKGPMLVKINLGKKLTVLFDLFPIMMRRFHNLSTRALEYMYHYEARWGEFKVPNHPDLKNKNRKVQFNISNKSRITQYAKNIYDLYGDEPRYRIHGLRGFQKVLLIEDLKPKKTDTIKIVHALSGIELSSYVNGNKDLCFSFPYRLLPKRLRMEHRHNKGGFVNLALLDVWKEMSP